jgi:hypothetical protein
VSRKRAFDEWPVRRAKVGTKRFHQRSERRSATRCREAFQHREIGSGEHPPYQRGLADASLTGEQDD